MVLLKIKKNDGGIIKLPSILRYPSKVQNIDGNNIPYRSCDHIENITNDLNTVGHGGYADPGAKYKNAIAGRNGSRKHPSIEVMEKIAKALNKTIFEIFFNEL